MKGYYEVPGEVLEEDELLGPWMRQALGVASAAARKKVKRVR
jgi:hypothetical protein